MQEYEDYGWSAAEAPSHAYLLPTLLGLLGGSRRRRILDVGCGSGALTKKLLSLGYDAYGVDASESGIALARAGAEDRFFVVNASWVRLPPPLEGVPFDTVIATEVIEHLYNPGQFVGFCRSVLPAGGELIVSTPYHGYLKNLALALLGQMDRHFTALRQGGHIKFWSRRTLTALLTQGGFQVERFRGCGRVPLLWKSMFLTAVRLEESRGRVP